MSLTDNRGFFTDEKKHILLSYERPTNFPKQ